jgi:hypothetical protein
VEVSGVLSLKIVKVSEFLYSATSTPKHCSERLGCTSKKTDIKVKVCLSLGVIVDEWK